ncbi:hypothetical protein CEP54_012494 [Fusarium duplospermum]|uniref:Uncharacterized protein n=1 Tax=Fusarium duplospermum TaxID=1325734 RepID=A0A428P8G2_9HYPO|nr:hypothetical protein CEP54_012494 [Fusarium duplospermum]
MAGILVSSEPGMVISSVRQGDLIGYYTISSSSVGTAYCPGSGALRERSGFYYCEDGFEVEGGSVYEIGRSCSGDKVLIERFTGRESTGSTWAHQWKKKSPDDPEKSGKGFMGVLRRIPRPTVTWSRPPDENKEPDSEVIQKAELSTGPETQAKAKKTTDPETAELETRERPGELVGREVQQGPFEMDATPVPKEAAAATPAQDVEERVEEAKTNDTQEDAKREAKT